MNLERLKLADFVLDACGIPMMPDGVRRVPLFRSLIYSNVIAGNTYLPDEKQATQSETFFILSSISCSVQTGALIYVRFQWPNGRYFTDQEELFQTGYGVGQNRRALGAEVIPGTMLRGTACPPGTSIRFTLNNKNATPQAVVIGFHGCDLYWVAKGDTPPCCVTHL